MKMGDGDQAAANPGLSSEETHTKTENSADLAHYFPENGGGGLSPALSQKWGTRPPVPPVAEPLVSRSTKVT